MVLGMLLENFKNYYILRLKIGTLCMLFFGEGRKRDERTNTQRRVGRKHDGRTNGQTDIGSGSKT